MTLTLNTLTETQRQAMRRIHAVRDLWFQRHAADVASGLLPATSTASEWVSVDLLRHTNYVPGRTIDALVRKGYLLRRDTDGFGPEVKSTVDW